MYQRFISVSIRVKSADKMDKVILVNKDDKAIGFEDKVKAHLGQGILHRAFTILVFNKKDEVLIQKREENKMLWPLVWETTCSSHPCEGENYEEAGARRLKQELGFACPLKLVDRFVYKANYKDVGSENEVCALLKGEYNGDVNPDPNEIAEWKWISLTELRQEIKRKPEQFAPWLKIALKKLEKIEK